MAIPWGHNYTPVKYRTLKPVKVSKQEKKTGLFLLILYQRDITTYAWRKEWYDKIESAMVRGRDHGHCSLYLKSNQRSPIWKNH
jgi:hypothetical protein